MHGAIDARVRELEPQAGALLHAGRSRNDQVATTLALYAHDRALQGAQRTRSIARHLLARASEELNAQTLLAATTHMQPAQPVLLAFWLAAAAEPFVACGTPLYDRRRLCQEQLSARIGRGRGFDAAAGSQRGVQTLGIRSSLA